MDGPHGTFESWFTASFPPEQLGKRYSTFLYALSVALARNLRTVVETGTVREADSWQGDGQSTRIFGAVAQRYGLRVWTCDIEPANMAACRQLTAPYAGHITYVVGDSIAFLSAFPEPIDFLYLDSLDYDFDNPEPSQVHHLAEFQAAEGRLHAESVILVDDCDLPAGGKGGKLVPYLLDNGWQTLETGYQVLLVRVGSSPA